MVLYSNFYKQTQINDSTLLLSMKRFPNVQLILIILFSTSIISSLLGSAQEGIQANHHSSLDLILLIENYPFSVIIISTVLLCDFIIFFYRVKIEITESEVIVSHTIFKLSFKYEKYEKNYCQIRIESSKEKIISEKSNYSSAYYIIRLRYQHPIFPEMKIHLINFDNKTMDLGKSYILVLQNNKINLHESVNNFFQLK